jgi:hypothetical protein
MRPEPVSPSVDWYVTDGMPIVSGMPSVAKFLAAFHARLRAVFGAALIVSSLSLGVAPQAIAQDQLTVVELFTSQGCPACPRADKLLGELAGRADILALSFHVDYWDYYGWADPFASEVYSQRQQRYLNQRGLPYVYTPQIVVDGRWQASGNKPAEVLENIGTARGEPAGRVSVRLERISDEQIRIRIPETDARYRGEADIMLVRFDEKHVTEVTRGENRGKTIVNHHVVRLIRPVARWNGEAVDVVVSLQELDGADPAYCAILVQEHGQGRILGAIWVDMREPEPRG